MSEQGKPAFGPGSFMWWELATRDLDKAKDFYTKVIGWNWEEMDMGPAGTYNLMKVNGESVGGMMGMDSPDWGELPSHWSYYIHVADVDKSTEQAKELGGTVNHGPTDIPGVGRFSAIADPAGTHFYLMTPAQPSEKPLTPAPGVFIWVELMSRDIAKSNEFFSKLLGWNTEVAPMPTGDYHLYLNDGAHAGGGMQMPDEAPAEAPSCFVGYIMVPDVDATLKTAEAEGGSALFPIMEVPNVGRFTQIVDPTGAVVAIMTPAMPE